MIHVVLPVGMLQCNCSIFGDEKSREAVVVDPGDQVDDILDVLARHELRVSAIVITHSHIDHIAGAAKLRKLTNAAVYLNAQDKPLLDMMDMQARWLNVPTPEPTAIDSDLTDGTVIRLGQFDFHVLHTPGHTPGSISLWIPAENKLVAGDTLFRESIGRTDLPGGDGRKILSSIKTKLLNLPENATVIPGHGAPTTIGHEKERNPFLRNL